MVNRKLFPCAHRLLAACFVFSLCLASASAQTPDTRPRLSTTSTSSDLSGIAKLENDVLIVSLAEQPTHTTLSREAKPFSSLIAPRAARFNQLLLTAIDTRLGAPYVYGAAGPTVFDCSGFVWSAFQSAGISFERVSARNLWAEFAPASKDDEHTFGTLVFFNGLSHIGIVAEDGQGFYHASTSKGVTYSPFKGYWENRVDGFRRIPMPAQSFAE
ncbi:MAG: C40 family peptidase [Pyrinomonadaceae bacterium]